jgi:molybdopterin-guanine dinucleotide biosynthesis protein A
LSHRPAAEEVLLVLAGGRSLRFGSDKALADLGDGEPLALRALRRLAPLASRRVLVRAAPIAGLPDDVVQVADPTPGDGPLQALEAAFLAAPASRWFVAPCDAPDLTPELYRPLAEAAGRDGVACARRGGRLEPLVAVWTSAAAARLAQAPRPAGVEAVHHALLRLGAASVEFAEEDPRFRNVNTPEDRDRAKRERGAACASATTESDA